MRIFAVLACVVATRVVAAAQDTVKLEKGTLYRGVVLEENDETIRLITREGEMVRIPVADVRFVRRARPLDDRIARRLEEADRTDADALYRIVAWAGGLHSLRKDARRVALMVLAIDPDHADARAFLGHVRALGVWHPSLAAAKKAVAVEMKAKGYKKYGEGWADPAVVADVKAAPAEWMVDGFVWRLVSLVMKERGLTEWRGSWYPQDEEDVVAECELIEKRIDLRTHGARVGANVVICFQDRKTAQENAKRLDHVRRWFVKTFDAGYTDLVDGPQSLHYVFETRADLGEFARAWKDVHGLSDENVAFYLKLGSIPWGHLDHAVDTSRDHWEASLVSQLGGRLLENFLWNGGFDMPDWMFIAAAHHAEIAVFGKAVIWYVSPDAYGRREDVRTDEGRDMSTVKAALRDMAKRGKLPTLKTLFSATTNTMTADLDTMGIAYLQFFLTEHREAWLGFITGVRTKDGEREKRFRSCFGKDWQEMHREFRTWLGA